MAKKIKAWPLRTFLAWTASVIDQDGWVPKSRATPGHVKGKATADAVVKLLDANCQPLTKANLDRYAELVAQDNLSLAKYDPSNTQYKEASLVVGWAFHLSDAECAANSYANNLRNLARQGAVTPQVAGLAASMVPEYRKRLKSGVKN